MQRMAEADAGQGRAVAGGDRRAFELEARQVDAVVLKDEILRLVDIPLVIKLPGMPSLARGAQVKLDLLRWDEVDLSIEARLLEIAAVPDAAADEAELDYEEETGDDAAEEGEVAAEVSPEAANQVSDADAEVAELASEDVVSEPEVK